MKVVKVPMVVKLLILVVVLKVVMTRREGYSQNDKIKSCKDLGNIDNVSQYIKDIKAVYDRNPTANIEKLEDQLFKLDGNLDGEFCERTKVEWKNHPLTAQGREERGIEILMEEQKRGGKIAYNNAESRRVHKARVENKK